MKEFSKVWEMKNLSMKRIKELRRPHDSTADYPYSISVSMVVQMMITSRYHWTHRCFWWSCQLMNSFMSPLFSMMPVTIIGIRYWNFLNNAESMWFLLVVSTYELLRISSFFLYVVGSTKSLFPSKLIKLWTRDFKLLTDSGKPLRILLWTLRTKLRLDGRRVKKTPLRACENVKK